MKDEDFLTAIIERARNANCSALVLTLDLQLLGQRHLDIKNGLSVPLRISLKNWFDTADCSMWCDMAGTNQEYIKKLFQNLQYNYNSGKITKDNLRYGIRRLEKKI